MSRTNSYLKLIAAARSNTMSSTSQSTCATQSRNDVTEQPVSKPSSEGSRVARIRNMFKKPADSPLNLDGSLSKEERSSSKTVSEKASKAVSRKSSPKKPKRLPELRKVLGRVLHNKAIARRGWVPRGPTTCPPEKVPTVGRGTPGKATEPQELTPSGFLCKVQPERMIPLRASILHAMLILQGKSFREDIPQNAEMLCFCIADHVEATGVLAGYSSPLRALACGLLAEHALECGLFDRETFYKYRVHAPATQSAWKAIWRSRTKFREVFQSNGVPDESIDGLEQWKKASAASRKEDSAKSKDLPRRKRGTLLKVVCCESAEAPVPSPTTDHTEGPLKRLSLQ